MKSFVIFAAVVLICQSAKVPQQVTQQVMVPVPLEVLAAPPPPTTYSSKDTPKPEIPAQVMKVAKDDAVKRDEKQKVMTLATMKPETKIMMMPTVSTMPGPSVATEMKRKTRAVPFKDNESVKSHTSKPNEMNMMKDMWAQRMHTVAKKLFTHRFMRSVQMEITTKPAITDQPLTVTKNPVVVKSSDSSPTSSSPTSTSAMPNINPCDLLCTKFEFEPICATNGLCLHEFPNQCILETYNCKHPKGKFAATKDDRCQMNWLTKCDESEMI